MTPDDLRSFRVRHQLPQAQMADILEISRHAVMEWQAGSRPIPAWLGLALAAYDLGLAPYEAPAAFALPSRRRVNRDPPAR